MFKSLPPTVQIAHQYLRSVLRPGGVAIDATAGNGYDTLVLAESVSPGGRVYSFDIQDQAVRSTRELVTSRGFGEAVSFFCESHDRIGDVVPESVDAVVFNLGYLPGGNRDIVTEPETTIGAVAQGLKLLKPSGIMCIVVYTGHPGGKAEEERIEKLLSQLDKHTFCAAKLGFVNRKNAPGLLIIEKNSLASEVGHNEGFKTQENP